MGLGRFLLRTALRPTGSLVRTAVITGAATAATVAVTSAINSRAERREQTQINTGNVKSNSQNGACSSYEDILVARLAVGYYLAGIDGNISPDEQLEIDRITSEILCLDSLSQESKSKLDSLSNRGSLTFMQIAPFLNVLDNASLIGLVDDVERIALCSEGILPSEARAIEIFKNFVSTRTGCKFEQSKKEHKVTTVSLTCDHCNGTMELDATYLKATCPYCGSAKIIDASQISSVMNDRDGFIKA